MSPAANDPAKLDPAKDLVQQYLERNFRTVFWTANGDIKGPNDKGWPEKIYTLDDYKEHCRVGLLTGVEIAPGRYFHDIDIDWAPGSLIAQALLPPTPFVFGRPSKPVSHCGYTTSEVLPSFKYEDVDGTCLIEFRGTKLNGSLGMQTMAPPSIWSKGEKREALAFIRSNGSVPLLAHIEAALLQRRTCHSAIGMILSKHLGINGFGHESRLAWAGFLLRAGVAIEELISMGEAMSTYCNNREIQDVRRAVESTAAALNMDGKKVKGGPALAKLVGKAVVTRINEWLGREGDFARDSKGHIIPRHQDNIRRAVELLGHELSYNEFADKLLIDGKPMEDREVNSLLTRIEIDFNFQPPDGYFERVIKFLAWSNPFHPVKQYLNGLTWDKVPRVDGWLTRAAQAEDTPYVHAIGSIMLIAAVRRIRQPGAKYDEMIVWESVQGSLKSTAAQALCADPSWFTDDLQLNVKSQQLIEATLGKWIIEASELSGKRKTEIEQLKAMLSRQVDGPARMAYAHFPVERPRHFVIVGTTNSPTYLTDPTGGRRFWPVVVGRFDITWIKENRDQLWAEASVRESQGESIRLHEDLWPVAAVHQEARREIDAWEPVIRSMLLKVEPMGDGKRRVPTAAIWECLAIPLERRDRSASLRISDIMQRLGFSRTRVRPFGEDVQVGFVQVGELLPLDEGEEIASGVVEDVPF